MGRPWVGRAGQLLNRILQAINLSREEVYISRCEMPPSWQTASQGEVEACSYLKRQIEIINPQIIVCLGSLATRALVDPKAYITKLRGQWQKMGTRYIMPTFHPSALLRDPSKKKLVWQDMQKVEAVYKSLNQVM